MMHDDDALSDRRHAGSYAWVGRAALEFGYKRTWSKMEPTSKAPRGQLVQSVDRALDVLRVLSDRSHPQSALEIANQIGLHRTIVHRLLRTMAQRQIVSDRGDGKYQLGPGLIQLTMRYIDNMTLRRIALPYMIDLNAQGMGDNGWHVTLGVPAPSQIVIVERVWDPKVALDSLLSFPVGMPMTGTAAGRAFLSQISSDEASRWVSPDEYRAIHGELEQIRADGGLSFSLSDLFPGIGAIATTIFAGANGRPLGTLIVSGPNLEGQLVVGSRVADMVGRTAHVISSLIEPHSVT